jgi:hypothetical protein
MVKVLHAYTAFSNIPEKLRILLLKKVFVCHLGGTLTTLREA